HDPRGEVAPVRGAHGDTVARERELGDPDRLDDLGADGARPREERRIELRAPERQIEGLVRLGKDWCPRRALHPDLADLVNVDGGAEIVRELREAPVDAVADAAAARLVTRKPLSVEEQRG